MRLLRLDRRETADLVSGTALRDMLLRGERPPAEFTRPEVADVLIEAMGAAPPAADGDGLVSRHTASQS